MASYEQHIAGDVSLAFRLHYYLNRDDKWLEQHAWPVVSESAKLWASRVVKSSSGNWTVLQACGPDEKAGVVDSNLYTNAVAKQTLLFAANISQRLNISTPTNWTSIARQMYMPVVDGLYAGLVHPQFDGYKKGQQIEQSDVCLLQYPLEEDQDTDAAPESVWQNDLAYYQEVTLQTGFYTGDSSYSIAWVVRGNRSQSDAQFARAFDYMGGLGDTSNNPFNVWQERAGDRCMFSIESTADSVDGNAGYYPIWPLQLYNFNFLTGAGLCTAVVWIWQLNCWPVHGVCQVAFCRMYSKATAESEHAALASSSNLCCLRWESSRSSGLCRFEPCWRYFGHTLYSAGSNYFANKYQ